MSLSVEAVLDVHHLEGPRVLLFMSDGAHTTSWRIGWEILHQKKDGPRLKQLETSQESSVDRRSDEGSPMVYIWLVYG